MIEIEKKFTPSKQSIESIKRDSTFVSSKIMNDAYYDFADFELVKNDTWLRLRNNCFELKVSKNSASSNNSFDVYDEITDEALIKKTIGINDFEELQEIANLTTRREEYKLGEFSIVFDNITSKYDDFSYDLMEIEIMAIDENDVPIAIQKIKNLAEKHEISEAKTTAKLAQYFYEKHKEIYDVLGRK